MATLEGDYMENYIDDYDYYKAVGNGKDCNCSDCREHFERTMSCARPIEPSNKACSDHLCRYYFNMGLDDLKDEGFIKALKYELLWSAMYRAHCLLTGHMYDAYNDGYELDIEQILHHISK